MNYKEIDNSKYVEGDFTKGKREQKAASRRLLLAGIAIMVIAALYVLIVIQVCSGMCLFVPK